MVLSEEGFTMYVIEAFRGLAILAMSFSNMNDVVRSEHLDR